MGSSSKVIFALNALLEVNQRRFHHYHSLAGKLEEGALKKLCQLYATRSTDFTAALNIWRAAYGLSAYPEKKFTVFSITWHQMKGVFNSIEKNDILEQCEIIEKDSLKLYKTAIDLSFLPSETLSDIQNQMHELERACIMLKSMKMNMSSYMMNRAVA